MIVTFYPFSKCVWRTFLSSEGRSAFFSAFTITAPKDLYVVEQGSNVTIECRFPVEHQLDLLALVVYWEKDDHPVIQFVDGETDQQDSSFQGRASLPKEQILKGNAGLHIADVKLRDAGVYCCMISYGGADYKRITLKVNGKNSSRGGGLDLCFRYLCNAESFSLLEIHTSFSQNDSSLIVHSLVD